MPVAQVLYDKYAEAESTVDVLAILAVYGWVHILLLWPCVVAANHLGFEVRRVLLLVTAHFGRCCACSMIHALFACSPDFRVAIHGGTPDTPVLSAGLVPVQLRIQPGYGGVCVLCATHPPHRARGTLHSHRVDIPRRGVGGICDGGACHFPSGWCVARRCAADIVLPWWRGYLVRLRVPQLCHLA